MSALHRNGLLPDGAMCLRCGTPVELPADYCSAHKHPAAPVPASDCSPVSGAGTNPIGAGPGASRHLLSPTGEAGAPNLSNLSKPWGNDTICPGCNRGKTYSCICDPFFEDEDTPEPRFDPEGGWAFAERSALGMVKP